MDDELIQNYVKPMDEHCSMLLAEMDDIATALKKHAASNGHPQDKELVFRCIEAFIHHIAKVSIFLWPQKGAKGAIKSRAKELSEFLEIPAEHAFSNRDLRNSFEHIDERIDEWLAGNPERTTKVYLLGFDKIPEGAKNEDFFKAYDPAKKEFTFKGVSYNLQTLFDAAGEFKAKIRIGMLKCGLRIKSMTEETVDRLGRSRFAAQQSQSDELRKHFDDFSGWTPPRD